MLPCVESSGISVDWISKVLIRKAIFLRMVGSGSERPSRRVDQPRFESSVRSATAPGQCLSAAERQYTALARVELEICVLELVGWIDEMREYSLAVGLCR